jgi:hypothetical protein
MLSLLAVVAAVAAACGPAAIGAGTATTIPSGARGTLPPLERPPLATPPLTGPVGNVDRRFPELSVEPAGERFVVSVVDPAARAWRVRILGTDKRAGDALEVELRTGDVGYELVVRSVVDGVVVDENDLSGMLGEPTTAAGGCHPTLNVCYGSGDMTLPVDGNGEFRIGIDVTGPLSASLGAASASWTKPFVLGEWRETDVLSLVG